MRTAAVVLLLACLVPAVHAARSADARKATRALVAAVEPRRGLHHRSLVIIPLVAKTKAVTDGAVVGGADSKWKDFQWISSLRKPFDTAAITAPKKAPPALHPSGVLLDDPGIQERLLLYPLLQAQATTEEAATLLLRPLIQGPMPDLRPTGGLRLVAPPEFRQTLFHTKDETALRDLLALEGALAGLDPSGDNATLAQVFKAPKLQRQLKAAQKALAALPSAYGGQVLGHVAYLGNRPVELVLTHSTATYASFARQATRGLALSLLLWEALYARDGPPLDEKPPAWAPFLAETTRILKSVAAATAREERIRGRPDSQGELWRLRATTDKHGKKPSDIGWLLLDAKERAVWIEAWPAGEVGPLPPPAREPGGKGQNEDPHDRKGGALTKQYMERFLERFHKRRRAMSGSGAAK